MRKFFKLFGIIAFIAIIGFSMIACNKSGGSSGSDNSKSSGGGGKSLNSAEELKEYLDKQPANSPDKPIKVSMTINDPMFKSVADVIKSAGKYVILNITGNALTTIPDRAFYSCETLVSITIPNSVNSIGERAFSGCETLVSITIPNSVNSIGNHAFAGCTDLTSVTFATGSVCQSIGENAFSGCTSLTNVTIPNSVTWIRDGAFSGCESLTSVTIPNSVTSIGQAAFSKCESLTNVTFATGSNIPDANFGDYVFPEKEMFGNSLKTAYSTGKAGTYTKSANGSTWAKN